MPDAPPASFSLGPQLNTRGAQFSVASTRAERVELCLFADAQAAHERERIAMSRVGNRWQAEVAGLKAGDCYGFRAHGPWAPERGARFNADKLLLDPRARAITGPTRWHALLQPELPGDSAPLGLRSVLVDERGFDWRDDALPRIPWHDTVLYEVHVKGMTARHPDLPPELRGTYLGLCQPAVLEHLKQLGVTTLSLLPIHEVFHEKHLVELGLSNYWGYATLGYFAPSARLASVPGRELDEFRQLVRTLHAHGFEVLLDVVYNHTAEGNEIGPMLNLRGLDDGAYYRRDAGAPDRYQDFTGCGNTVDLRSPLALELVLDSLRYWAEVAHVDGFRFDLTSTLCRDAHGFDPGHIFLRAVEQDPVLSSLKLVAEPWDLGNYAVGAFPPPWRQWNDRFRDTTRAFFAGEPGRRNDLATRLSGSADLLQGAARDLPLMVNFVTCHDGFTLWDVVSYERKHNEANGEQNRDGTNQNHSRNWGTEGDTDDPRILELRARLMRSMLLGLCTAQAVPMLAHGDELGNSQHGNNNAYCHDNELTWLDWTAQPRHEAMLAFTRAALQFRARHRALRPERLLHGAPAGEGRGPDLSWIGPNGRPLSDAEWRNPESRVLGMLVRAAVGSQPAARCDAVLCLFNASADDLPWTLPELELPGRWRLCLDAAAAHTHPHLVSGHSIRLRAHSALALEHEVNS
jgi:isoamylase